MVLAAIHYASPQGDYSDVTEDEQRQQMGLAQEGETQEDDRISTAGAARTRFKDNIRALHHTWHSTKIDACVFIIKESIEDKDSGKILVFYDYITCLDILAIALEEEKISYSDLNGQMTLTERQKIVHAFQNEDDPLGGQVLLLTSRCGSFGLTLTAASTVIMLNDSRTPLNDAQYVARANRIGQKRVVKVHRLHVQHSIEERKALIASEKMAKFNELITNARAIDSNITRREFEELVSNAESPTISSAKPKAA